MFNIMSYILFQNDDAPVSLMEMRFFIPSNELAGDLDPVESFQQQVMQKASVISVSGDAIAIFREIQCLTPRYLLCNLNPLETNLLMFMFLVVVTILRCSRPFFSSMVKLLITKFLCQPSCGCLFYLTRIPGRCFSL